MRTDQDFDPRIAWEARCKHSWVPHRIMGAHEQCEDCGEVRDSESPAASVGAGDTKEETK